jgi:uncharacterized membrane protein YphA (DoxX/SURF4 family)
MKVKAVGYWVATTLIGAETIAGGVTDLAHGRTSLVSGPFVADIVTHLGYPVYLLTILGVWKLLGGMTIFLPGLPRLKEWAYAGIVFELTGAAASWALHGDPADQVIVPLVLTAFAVLSWALRPPSRTLGTLSAGNLPA